MFNYFSTHEIGDAKGIDFQGEIQSLMNESILSKSVNNNYIKNVSDIFSDIYKRIRPRYYENIKS